MYTNFFKRKFWEESSIKFIQERIEELFKVKDLSYFFSLLNSNSKTKDYFIYYCWFFSNESSISVYLSRKDLPLEHILDIILAGLSLNEAEMRPIDYYSFWSEKLNSEQSLRLLEKSKKLELHPVFIACLLINLNAKSWEDYFNSLATDDKEIYDLLKLYENFSIYDREKVFARNSILYKYFNLLISLIITSYNDQFLLSLKQSIDKLVQWEDYVNGMKSAFSIEAERTLSLRQRNSNRISCIIHDANTMNVEDSSVFLTFLLQHSVIIDEAEMKLIETVINMQNSTPKFRLKKGMTRKR
ncbi:hypothetical protein [Leptospira sp. GIMC2001]|uniref:hypothetical protein n=1 Tax=Leptospira sp. GIMC2001 TaxID=1513297 RepID=UPI00234A2544|nr:hypothetical protein [Leptospira sp. GIMC2001]WCL50849.1 hypothetical protein O4O04_08560 [Leptospira sp. GIMC2001]